MNFSIIKNVLSVLALGLFIFLAVGSVDEEPEYNIDDTWSVEEESASDTAPMEDFKEENNDWLIGIWSNRGYSNSGANMTVKIQLNPRGKGRLYLLDQWLECTYEVYGDVVVANRNDVDIQFSFDKDIKALYMADGTRLYKQ